MKIVRKFNINRYYKAIQYETIEIEMEGQTIEQVIHDIDEAFTVYLEAIRTGKTK